MSINQMTCYHTLTETFNIINYGASEKIHKKLLPKSYTSSNLTVPLCRKVTCRSFSYYASRLWNKLPVTIRASAMPASLIKNNPKAEQNRLKTFKKEVKKTNHKFSSKDIDNFWVSLYTYFWLINFIMYIISAEKSIFGRICWGT